MIDARGALALFIAGLAAGLWLLNKVSDAVFSTDEELPDRGAPRPRRVRPRRAGGLTPGLVWAALMMYCAALAVVLDKRFAPMLVLTLAPLAAAFWSRRRELRLLENGDIVEGEVRGNRRLWGRRGYAGRSLTVAFEHRGKKMSLDLYVARHDPREGSRVTLLVDPDDSEDVLVYEDSSFRISPGST